MKDKDHIYYKYEGLDESLVNKTYQEQWSSSNSMSACSTYMPTKSKVKEDLMRAQWDSSAAKEKTYE